MTPELTAKLGLNGPLRAVIVLLVVRVEYADGSVYNAEATYEAYRQYAERLTEILANAKAQ